jgi:hypothetical protein
MGGGRKPGVFASIGHLVVCDCLPAPPLAVPDFFNGALGALADPSTGSGQVYKQAETAVHFEKVVAGSSRYHKYALGTDLRNKGREVVGPIVRANSTREGRITDLLMNSPSLRAFALLGQSAL